MPTSERTPQQLAWARVAAAVRDGRLIPQPCVVCWSMPSEAHHPRGYEPEHQLDVVWLCKRCHERIHGRSTTADPPGEWRLRRLAIGVSLGKVAREAGLGKGRVSVIERGITPTDAERVALEAALAKLALVQVEGVQVGFDGASDTDRAVLVQVVDA